MTEGEKRPPTSFQNHATHSTVRKGLPKNGGGGGSLEQISSVDTEAIEYDQDSTQEMIVMMDLLPPTCFSSLV